MPAFGARVRVVRTETPHPGGFVSWVPNPERARGSAANSHRSPAPTGNTLASRQHGACCPYSVFSSSDRSNQTREGFASYPSTHHYPEPFFERLTKMRPTSSAPVFRPRRDLDSVLQSHSSVSTFDSHIY